MKQEVGAIVPSASRSGIMIFDHSGTIISALTVMGQIGVLDFHAQFALLSKT
jgi:F0F1-type ATP synthase epsilon subunit